MLKYLMKRPIETSDLTYDATYENTTTTTTTCNNANDTTNDTKSKKSKSNLSSSSSNNQEQLSFLSLEKSIPEDWKKKLLVHVNNKNFNTIKSFLMKEDEKKESIYPPINLIFNALNKTSWEKCKVIIIGQDPYHGENQAMGLCFSIPKGIKLPPSLQNIYKELEKDIKGFKNPGHGDLTKWANEGVLLLNTSLTVKAANANSHSKIGWIAFTDAIIDVLNKEKENLVFILWGGNAIEKESKIDQTKHLVLKSPHPSGLSAHKKTEAYPNGFFMNHHFSKTNEYLVKYNKRPIDWKL